MDKSRQQFEEWFAPQKEEMKRNGLGMISITRMHQRQWMAWQASRESLELIIKEQYTSSYIYDDAYANGFDDGIDAVDALLKHNRVTKGVVLE